MSVPLIDIAAMREWESATWAAGQTEAEVIRQVGLCVARKVCELTAPNDSVLILAGKGHNGDDARAATNFLADRKVNLLNLVAPETDLPELESALRGQPALVVDGLFGIGLNRPLSEPWQKIINTVNAARLFVLAVDIPSGLDADKGEVWGAAIEADITLTVGAPKQGLLVQNAGPFVGRLEVARNVGLIPCPIKSDLIWTEAEDFRLYPPRRPAAGHKGSFGHVAIVAGSLGYHGAAVLAACGARRAQPGLVTVYPQENVYLPVASQLKSAMVGIWRPEIDFPASITALAVGPGLAAREAVESLRPVVPKWWRNLECPVIVDASALDLLVAGPCRRNLCRVVTPHPGEAARMLNMPTQKIEANRVGAVRQISKKFGNCWVVLKGRQTLIGQSEGAVFVNSSGNPYLAQGGSGDLLTGFVAGLLAQPPLQADVAGALRYAVWQHGAAADQLQKSRRHWTVEDLADEIGSAR